MLPVARRASAPASAAEVHAADPAGAHAGHGHATPTAAPSVGPAPRVQRAAASGTASPRASTAARPAASAPASSARPAVRPTVGANPLRPRVAAPSTTAGASPATSSAEPDAPAPAAVAARWSSAGDLPATVSELPVQASGDQPVALQRLAASPAPAAATAPSPPPMREIVFPAPGTASIPLTGLPTAMDFAPPFVQRAAESPGVAAPSAATTSRPALALARPPAPAAPSLVEASVPGPSVRRLAPGASGSAPVVQTSRADASPLPQLTVTPIVQREDSSTPTPTVSTAAPDLQRSEKELDQLAQDLFGRFRTRLRSEVIQEREARGLGFDAF